MDLNKIVDNIERAGRMAAENRANAERTDATRIMDSLMVWMDQHVTAPDYMAAENSARRNDMKERAEWREDSDTVGDLRRNRDSVLDDARALAESIARLRRDIDALTR